MRKLILVVVLATISLTTKAQQTNPHNDSSKKAHIAVRTFPTFPGGISKFYEYLAKNAKYNGSDKGEVLIMFVVEEDGSLTNVKVEKGLSKKADKEAVRSISGSPKWTPLH